MSALVIAKQVKNAILYTNGAMRIDNVIASYPHLDERWSKADSKTGKKPPEKYSLVGLLDKKTHGEAYELIEERIKALEKEAKIKVALDDWFCRDGDRTRKEENEGRWTLNASEQREVTIRDVKGNKLRDEKGNLVGVEHANEIKEMFYPGCVVSIMIRPWAQDNEFGKKINAGLVAVKFMRDGDRLGGEQMTDDGAWNDEDSGSDLDGDDEM
ncbi:hypothetical protein ADP64_000006 [Achromobacter phage phiAxp-2]|uniref:DUF2815 family protein n=1 Tax=Achromobacter phage phiAxp-2 TaxID=1664246 RepID=A0A0K2FHX2_9CAUD|nr:hypothetical protein ADP64_000006 [Achromobacter phage phiAxp-2]ALA45464.1 hypothetical protein ADP64_000006 [Achromobacter phage phiAxp-2]